jgi:hypothetical protein
MNKRKKTALSKHRKRQKRLQERRKQVIAEGGEALSKGKMKRLLGAPVPPASE